MAKSAQTDAGRLCGFCNVPASRTLRPAGPDSQAAISVPANLAEGAGRTGDREFRRFVRIALGSASELEYHLLLARDLGLIPKAKHAGLSAAVSEVKRMLTGLAATLSNKPHADG